MNTAVQELETRAIKSAGRLLKQAAVFLDAHAPRLLFRKTMKLHIGSTNKTCLLHVELPGVLRVYDAATGELLAESASGQFDRLGAQYTGKKISPT